MFVAIDRRPAGLLGVADPIRESSPEAIRSLHATGVRIVMLTGDHRATAEAVALQLGIDEIRAEVMRDIRQNLFFAFVYNTIGVPIAAGVLYPVLGWS
jgi:Cu+-exporting ATPase